MGSTKTRTSSKCNEIQTADGAIMQAKIIGNIPVVYHDKRGMNIQIFVCKEVTHTTSGRLTLFSLSTSVTE